MQTVIFVRALSDNTASLTLILLLWEKDGINVQVHTPWKKRNEGFERKLTRLLEKIDRVSKKGGKVSLVGISAGDSLIRNAYVQEKVKSIDLSPSLLDC